MVAKNAIKHGMRSAAWEAQRKAVNRVMRDYRDAIEQLLRQA